MIGVASRCRGLFTLTSILSHRGRGGGAVQTGHLGNRWWKIGTTSRSRPDVDGRWTRFLWFPGSAGITFGLARAVR